MKIRPDLIAIWVAVFLGLAFLYKFAFPLEEPMTSQERAYYAQERQKALAREAYYKRIEMVISEATEPDADFISKVERDNHKWCGETLKETSLKLESTSAELSKTKTELERLKAWAGQVPKP